MADTRKIMKQKWIWGNLQPVHPEDFVRQVRDLWDKGLSLSQIGDAMGVTREVIAGISYRNDFPSRAPAQIKLPREKIIDLQKQGLNMKQISAEIGKRYGSVRKAMISMGLHVPTSYPMPHRQR